MSESGMRGRITQALRELDAVAVENPAYPGTPDVNFVEGWIELKWLRNWPVRETSKVPVPHFTPQQRVWLRKRQAAGGNVFLLLQCKKEWLLFDGDTAAKSIDIATRAELIQRAKLYMPNGLVVEELISCLTANRRDTTSRSNSSISGAANGC